MESLNFNLREPRKKSLTPLYAVIKWEGKQYKIPTGCKIAPWEWNERKQQPKPQAEFATHIISVINGITLAWLQVSTYLCGEDRPSAQEICAHIRETIVTSKPESMANAQNLTAGGKKKATTLLKAGYEKYAAERRAIGKEPDGNIKGFFRQYMEYLTETGKDTKSSISTKGMEAFKAYLLAGDNEERKPKSAKQTNKILRYLCEKINKYVVPCNDGMLEVKFTKAQEVAKMKDDTKYFPLMAEEVETLRNVERLTEKQEEARDVFLMLCETGVRVEDCHKLFSGEYTVKDGVIKMETEKRKKYAFIPLTEEFNRLTTKYENGFKTYPYEKKDKYQKSFIKLIREAAEKAGLNRTIKQTNEFGKTSKKSLYEAVSPYCGRYTFVYRQININKKSVDVVSRMCGNTPKMIERIYGRWDDDTIISMVKDEPKQVQHEEQESANVEELIKVAKGQAEQDRIKEYKEVLSFMGIPYTEYAAITDSESLFRIIAKYEAKAIEKGYSVERLKQLFNNFAQEDYAAFRRVMATK